MQKLPINPFLDFYATPDAMIINPFVFGGGAFDPLTLSPALWLSDTGSDPATWPDLSGNGRDATQATAGSRPAIITGELNGRQVRRFDGSNDFLSAGDVLDLGTNSLSIFAVAKYANSGDGAIVGKSVAAIGQGRFSILRSSGDGGLGVLFANSSSGYFAASADSSSSARILTATINRASGDLSLRVNGSIFAQTAITVESVDLNNATRLLVGAYSNASDTAEVLLLNGDIAEILVFPTALSTTDRQNVEAYLNAKYNIY